MAQMTDSLRRDIPRLTMQNVSKRFGATTALSDVSLSVYGGTVHALIGENGAGKSTLMKVLSGAIVADSGQMALDGQPYCPRTPMDGRRRGVGMIYQELSLAGHLTVEENILLGLEPTRFGFVCQTQLRQKAVAALRYFDHPEITPTTKVRDLSVGAQQLIEIARAIAMGCGVLVFDEPTSALSGDDVTRLFRLIEQLKRRGMAIVYISHFLEEVKAIADVYTVLRDGQTVGSGDVRAASTQELAALMVGRQLGEMYVRSPRTPGQPIMSVEGLRGVRKPLSASFELRRGEVLGIAGLVGAGRTELMRAIFGLDPIRKGQVRIGVYSGPAVPAQRWKQGVGLLSEDRKGEGLALSMSVADNITLTQLLGLGAFGLISPRRQRAAAQMWIDKLNIKCRHAGQSVVSLSGGNQQKAALARLLRHNVDILLLDEPTRGIDVVSKRLIYECIDKLACGDRERNIPPKAVLIVSSYLPELFGVCDRIAVMCRGRLNSPHPVEGVTHQTIILEAAGATGG